MVFHESYPQPDSFFLVQAMQRGGQVIRDFGPYASYQEANYCMFYLADEMLTSLGLLESTEIIEISEWMFTQGGIEKINTKIMVTC